MDSREEFTVLKGPTAVQSLRFSPDGKMIATAGYNGVVGLWPVAKTTSAGPTRHNQKTPVFDVTFSPDGTRIASSGFDGTIRLWNTDGLTPVSFSKQVHESYATGIVFYSGGSRIASVGPDGKVRLWDVESTVQVGGNFKGRDQWRRAFAIASDGRHFATGGADRHLWLSRFEAETPRSTKLGTHPGPLQTVAVNTDGTVVASAGSGGRIYLWEAAPRESQPGSLNGHTGLIYALQFSPDGKVIASAGMDKTIRLWDVATRTLIATLPEPLGQQVLSVAFDPLGKRIVSSLADGKLRLWDTTQHKSLDLLNLVPDRHKPFNSTVDPGDPAFVQQRRRQHAFKDLYRPFAVAFSPDGRHIAATGYGRVNLVPVSDDRFGSATAVLTCDSKGIFWTGDDLLISDCRDRVSFYSSQLTPRGDLFLLPPPRTVAIARNVGVFAFPHNLKDTVRTFFGPRYRGTPHLRPAPEAYASLFNRWTLWNTFRAAIRNSIDYTVDVHQRIKAVAGPGVYPIWLLLSWATFPLITIFMWLFFPTTVAWWAMPTSVENPGSRRLLASIRSFNPLPFLYFFGHTRRAVRSWFRKYRSSLQERCFNDVPQVTERAKYYSGIDVEVNGVKQKLTKDPGLYWISGVGGSGKSALAMHMLRDHIINNRTGSIPVLVDEEWGGSLTGYVAARFFDTRRKRGPTDEMIKLLGQDGSVYLLIDSLSERRRADALEQLRELLDKRLFRHLIVTSRDALPQGQTWRMMKQITPKGITDAELRGFVAVYLPGQPTETIDRIYNAIVSLLNHKELPSPLFLRFAIEQATKGSLENLNSLSLTYRYLEELRRNNGEIGQMDMVRAASVAAVASIRERLYPLAVSEEKLRNEFDVEADQQGFFDHGGSVRLTSPNLIEILIRSGVLLRRTADIQFAYDPVAEYLAAARILTNPSGRLAGLRAEVEESAATPVGRAYRVIKESLDEG